MKLDLLELKRMHPLLPARTASEYVHRAAVGLGRSGHRSGLSMETRFDDETRAAELHWMEADLLDAEQLDRDRITEDAAEAVALAFVHECRGWKVRRRLQRGDHADWLLHDPEKQMIALEVSGVGTGEDPGRLRQKLQQVARVRFTEHRAACVVELPAPRTTARTI